MSELVTLALHGPDFSSDRFYVTKEGEGYQRWTEELYDGEELACFIEERWQPVKVDSWFTDDASGNAPEIDRHFFFTWEDAEGGKWRYDLRDGLQVRMDVPTDEELQARPKLCLAYVWGWYPSEDRVCNHAAERYLSPVGKEAWYCPDHVPDWMKKPVTGSLEITLSSDIPLTT